MLKRLAQLNRHTKPMCSGDPVGFRFRLLTIAVGIWAIGFTAHAQEATSDCDNLTSAAFFEAATIEDVGRCFDAQNINTRDADGNTPLHLAALTDADAPVIRMLLRMGADPSLRNIDERTPLHIAAIHATSGDTITSLLIYGADVNARIRGDRDLMIWVTGTTAMHLATRREDGANAVAALLLGGAELDARDTDTGRTPLHYAANVGDPALIDVLRRAGAKADDKDNEGNTPLHVAALDTQSRYIVNLMLLADGSVDARNDDKITPLMLAAAYNKNEEVVQYMFDASEEPCEADDQERSALSNATQNPDIFQTDVYWALFQLCTAGD